MSVAVADGTIRIMVSAAKAEKGWHHESILWRKKISSEEKTSHNCRYSRTCDNFTSNGNPSKAIHLIWLDAGKSSRVETTWGAGEASNSGQSLASSRSPKSSAAAWAASTEASSTWDPYAFFAHRCKCANTAWPQQWLKPDMSGVLAFGPASWEHYALGPVSISSDVRHFSYIMANTHRSVTSSTVPTSNTASTDIPPYSVHTSACLPTQLPPPCWQWPQLSSPLQHHR